MVKQENRKLGFEPSRSGDVSQNPSSHDRFLAPALSEDIYRPSHGFPASLEIEILLTRLSFY
jgi:hypothetical protein